MNEFSSDILANIYKAPLVEKVTSANGNYVIYQGFPTDAACTKCQIRRITYAGAGTTTEQWTTEFAEGSQRTDFDWADRTTLNYSIYK